MELVIGLLIIAIGAFCQSSSYVPINKIKDWSWESYWIIQGIFAWLLFPLIGSLLSVSGTGGSFGDLLSLINSDPKAAWLTILFGVLWGVGGLTFGLSMRYLGVALGQSIALGTCSGLGAILGPVFTGHASDLTTAVIVGVVVTLIGIAIIGVAGAMKASALPEEEKKKAVKDFNFGKGIFVALLAGFMSAEFRKGSFPSRDQAYIPDPSGYYARDLRRLPDQRRLLLLPEQQEQDLGRLQEGQPLGKQPRILLPGRFAVVQPVLWPQPWKGIPYQLPCPHHLQLVHPHGAQRHFLQCLGNYPQRMEGCLEKDYRRACHRPYSTGVQHLPSAADGKLKGSIAGWSIIPRYIPTKRMSITWRGSPLQLWIMTI